MCCSCCFLHQACFTIPCNLSLHYITKAQLTTPHLLLILPHLTCDQPSVNISPHLINLNLHHITSSNQTLPYSPHHTSPYFNPSQLWLLSVFSTGLAQVQWRLKHVKSNRPELCMVTPVMNYDHLIWFSVPVHQNDPAWLVLVPFCPIPLSGASNLQQCDLSHRVSSVFFFLQGICSGSCMTC
jgi:hypothetical protein